MVAASSMMLNIDQASLQLLPSSSMNGAMDAIVSPGNYC
jgi:hypothetical protein